MAQTWNGPAHTLRGLITPRFMHGLIIVNTQRCFQKLTKGRITLFEAVRSQASRRINVNNLSQEWAEPLTFHAGGLSPRGPGHLPREAGALHGLRALLDPVLVAAPVHGHNFTRALLHLVLAWSFQRWGMERKENISAVRRRQVVQPYRTMNLPSASLNPRNAKKQSQRRIWLIPWVYMLLFLIKLGFAFVFYLLSLLQSQSLFEKHFGVFN